MIRSTPAPLKTPAAQIRRVIHVVPGPERHGVTRHALETVAALHPQPPRTRTRLRVRHELLRILADADGPHRALDEAAAHALARLLPAGTPNALLHLHLADYLLGTCATRCADLVVALARRRPISLTLHDLPQPDEPRDGMSSVEEPGPVGRFARRRRAYARMAAHARGIVVASEHERALLTTALAAEGLVAGGPIAVIPLPLAAPVSPPGAQVPEASIASSWAGDADVVCAGSADLTDPTDPSARGGGQRPRDLVVFGYLYPGKGHTAALEALACLGTDARAADVGLLALGGPSPGHADLVDALAARARNLRRRFDLTGYLPEDQITARLRAAAVPVAAADHMSASGSIGSWLSAGRRPLVPTGAYVDELEARCPGALLRYGPGMPHPTLAAAVLAALANPRLTWLDAQVRLGPDADTCAAQLDTLLCDWARLGAESRPGTSDATGSWSRND